MLRPQARYYDPLWFSLSSRRPTAREAYPGNDRLIYPGNLSDHPMTSIAPAVSGIAVSRW